jgi:hypothetical protein
MGKQKGSGLTDKYWVTDFNFSDEVRKQFCLPEKVQIHDVTLREAEQTPHVVLRPEEKLRIFEAPVASVTPSPLWLYDFGEHSKATLRVYKGCFEILGIRLRYYL